MITMHAAPGATFKGATGLTYRADADGTIFFVRTGDVETLRAAGAEPVVSAATKHLKVGPGQRLYFAGRQHTASADGILHDVPHDQAAILIKNGSATEVTEADLEAADPIPPADVELANAPTPEPEDEPEDDVSDEDTDEVELQAAKPQAPKQNPKPYKKD